MIRKIGLGLLAAGVLCVPGISVGGDCSSLSVSQTDNGDTQTLSFDVTGSSAMSFHALLVGENAGDLSLPLPTGATLDLGIVPPFILVPLGVSDPMGSVSASFELPAMVGVTLNAQSIGVEFMPPDIGFCTSNTVTFTL